MKVELGSRFSSFSLRLTKAASFGAAFAFVFVSLITSSARANPRINLNGRILNSNGTAVSSSAVQFRVQVRSPGSENCLLYQEIQTIDMTSTEGTFVIGLNDGTGTRGDSSGIAFAQVFSNRLTVTLPSGQCASGTTYAPGSTDARKLVVEFNDGTFSGWEALPTQNLSFAPTALDTLAVGGFAADSLVRVSDGTVPGSVNPISTAQFASMLALTAGTSSLYVTSSTSTGVGLPSFSGGSVPSSLQTGSIWYDLQTNQVMFYNGSSSVALASSNAVVTRIVASTSLAANGVSGGTIVGSGTLDLSDTGVTAGTYAKLVVDAKGRATSGGTLMVSDLPIIATAGKVSGSAIAAGTIGGSTSLDTTGSIITTGSIVSATVSTSGLSARTVNFFNLAGTDSIQLNAPTSLGASYSLVLPAVGPSGSNFVMAANSSGSMSWVNLNSSFVSSIVAGTGISGGTITGVGTIALATSGVTAGSYGSAGYYPVVNVDAYGRVTGAGSLALTAASAAAGTTGSVQMNSAGTLAESGLYWDDSAKRLSVGASSGTYSFSLIGADPNVSTVFDMTAPIVAPAWGATEFTMRGKRVVGVYPGGAGSNTLLWNWTGSNFGNFAIGSNVAISPSQTKTTASNALDVDGAVVIGSGYAGASTAPTNGLLIQGDVGIGTSSPQAGLDVATTGTRASAIIVPRDTVANRPIAPVNGMIRYASDTNQLEAYVNGAWTSLSSTSGGTFSGASSLTGVGSVTGSGSITIGGAGGSSAGTVNFASGSVVNVNNTTASTSSSSGALVVSGGVGIGGALNVASNGSFGGALTSAGAIAGQSIATGTGSAASPSHTFTADTSTGMYLSGAGTFALSTSGTQRMVVTSAGNVGIGTTAPSVALHVVGNVTAEKTDTSTTGTVYTHSFSGVTAPGSASTATTYGLYALNQATGVSTKATLAGMRIRGRAASGNSGTITNLKGLEFDADNGGTGVVTNGFGFTAEVTSGSLGAITNAFSGHFSTNQGAAAITNAYGVYIDTIQGTNTWGLYQDDSSNKNYFAGNVGIGTTSPQAALDVATTGTLASAIIVPRDTTANRPSTPVNGMIRYNTSTTSLEGYANGAWQTLGGVSGGTSSGASVVSNTGNLTVSAGSTLTLTGTTGVTSASAVTFTNTTASTSSSSGALVVSGGVGIGGALNVAGPITTTAASTFSGGLTASPIYGSSAASGTLALESTSNSPKGVIALAQSGGNVIVGTGSASARLNVTPNMTSATNVGSSALIGSLGSVLGTTSGSYLYPFEIQAPTTNTLRFQVAPFRRVSGASWNGTAYRMQYAVDNSFTDGSKAYVEVGAGDPGTVGGGYLALGTNGTDRLVVNNTGYVGIGTTVPGVALEVAGLSSSSSILSYPLIRVANVNPTVGDGSTTFNYAGVRVSAGSGAVQGDLLASHATSGGDVSSLILRTLGAHPIYFRTSNSTRMTIDAAGRVGIGTTGPPAPFSVSDQSSVANASEEYNINSSKTYTVTDSGLKQSIRANLTASGTASLSTTVGVLSLTTNSSSGTIANAYGFFSRIDPGSASGVMSNASNFRVQDGTGSGQIGVQHGLYVEALTKGAANYAIFTAGTTPSYFGGRVGFGTTSPETSHHIFNTGTSTTLGQLDTNLRLASNTATVGGGSEISFRGNSGAASNVATYAAISGPLTGSNSTGAVGYLSFSTKPSQAASNLSERMRIDQNGNVGIGTTLPQAGLDIATTGALASAIIVPRDTTANRPSTPVDGMIRYNTSTAALEGYANGAWQTLGGVSGGTSSSASVVSNAGNMTVSAGSTLTLTGTTGVTSASAVTFTNATASTSSSSGALVVSGGVGIGGALNVAGPVTSTSASTFSGGLTASPIYGSNAASGALILDSTSSATKGVVAVALSGGNVGIGTSSPASRLEISENTTSNGTIAFSFTDNEQPGSLTTLPEIFGGSITNNFLIGMRDFAFINRNFTSHAGSQGFTFAQQIAVGSFSNLMYINGDSGNVGIGTVAPAGRLDVTGAQSVAASALGKYLSLSSTTLTDSTTVASGTALANNFNSIAASTLAASNGSVITIDAATLRIAGAPIKGTNNTATNAVALDVGSAAVGAHTNSYGLRVAAQTGAMNNYAASFTGGNVGIGTTVPNKTIDVAAAADPTIRLSEAGSTTSFSEITDMSATQMVIRKTAVTGSPIVDITPTASDGSSTAMVRLFRDTNTSNRGMFLIYRGDGSGTVDAQIQSGASSTTYFAGGGGNVGIGTTAPQAALDVSTTGTRASAIIVPRDTTANRPATPVNGMLRYNTNTTALETYANGAWQTLSGVSGGTSSSASVVSNTGNLTVSSGSTLTLTGTTGVTSASAVTFTSATASTSSSSGALVVSGGVGIGGALNVAGPVTSTSASTFSGGLTASPIYGSSAASGTLLIDSTSNATKGFVAIASGGGNVGVGTSTGLGLPGNLLAIGGAVTIGTSYWNIAGPSNGLMVQGRAGIGTSSPIGNLNVQLATAGTSFGPGGASNNTGLVVTTNNSNAVVGLTIASGGRNLASPNGWLFNMIGVNTTYDSATDQLKRYSTSGGFTDSQAITMSSDTGRVGGANRISFWGGSNSDPVERMVVTSTGSVGIGTTLPTEALVVVGNVAATSFISTSDARLKANVRTSRGLDVVDRLRGVTFDWKSDGRPEMGVIAQELEAVLPDAVVTNPATGFKSVKYQSLLAPLIESTKELHGMCRANSAAVERRFSSIEERNRQLERENRELKRELDLFKANVERERSSVDARLRALERRLPAAH